MLSVYHKESYSPGRPHKSTLMGLHVTNTNFKKYHNPTVNKLTGKEEKLCITAAIFCVMTKWHYLFGINILDKASGDFFVCSKQWQWTKRVD